MNYYFKLIIISIIFTIADITWISINKDLYLNTIASIQGSPIEFKGYLIIAITYIIMLLGLFTICLPLVELNINKYPSINKYLIAFLTGSLYGFVVNSIYNLTSYISYKNYTLTVAITDILWASMLYPTIAMIYISF